MQQNGIEEIFLYTKTNREKSTKTKIELYVADKFHTKQISFPFLPELKDRKDID